MQILTSILWYKTKTVVHTWVKNCYILFVVTIWTVCNVELQNKYYCIYKLKFLYYMDGPLMETVLPIKE
jgi:hypothetical protein